MTTNLQRLYRINRFLFLFRRRKLKREIRAALPIAIKNGPRSFEWMTVSDKSTQLRITFGE